MFKFISNFWDNSVDGILGEFHGLIARLETAVDHHSQKAGDYAQEAKRQNNLSTTAIYEATRAQNVADKLKSLVG